MKDAYRRDDESKFLYMANETFKVVIDGVPVVVLEGQIFNFTYNREPAWAAGYLDKFDFLKEDY